MHNRGPVFHLNFIFTYFRDEEEKEKKKSHTDGTDEKDNGSHPKGVNRIGNSNNPFLDIPHDPNAAVYKTGFLARKIHADMDGKKSEYLFFYLFVLLSSKRP